jgi:hypothetical protein
MTDTDTTDGHRGWRERLGLVTNRQLRTQLAELHGEHARVQDELRLERVTREAARAENDGLREQLREAGDESLREYEELRRLDRGEFDETLGWERTNGDLHRGMMAVAAADVECIVAEHGDTMSPQVAHRLECVAGRVTRHLEYHADGWGDFDPDIEYLQRGSRDHEAHSLMAEAEEKRARAAQIRREREGAERRERRRTVADPQGTTIDRGLHRVASHTDADASYVAISRGERVRSATAPDEGIMRSRGMTM